jgi:hypothetical protein
MQSAPKYFSSSFIIMALNYGLLAFMTAVLCIPGVLAKQMTETILFI